MGILLPQCRLSSKSMTKLSSMRIRRRMISWQALRRFTSSSIQLNSVIWTGFSENMLAGKGNSMKQLPTNMLGVPALVALPHEPNDDHAPLSPAPLTRSLYFECSFDDLSIALG